MFDIFSFDIVQYINSFLDGKAMFFLLLCNKKLYTYIYKIYFDLSEHSTLTEVNPRLNLMGVNILFTQDKHIPINSKSIFISKINFSNNNRLMYTDLKLNVEMLDNFPNLTHLIVDTMIFLSGAPKCPKLTTLELYDTSYMVDLTWLPQMTQIYTLKIVGYYNNYIVALPQVKSLNIWACNNVNLSKWTNLVHLVISDSCIISLSRLEDSPLLTTVQLDSCRKLVDIDSLNQCKQLKLLMVSHCDKIDKLQISNLSQVKVIIK